MSASPARVSGLRRIVAIVGCQRSGTTLTGQLLGADPSALLVDETDGVYPWIRGGGRDPALDPALLQAAAAKYVDPASRVCAGVLAPGVDTLVLKTPNLTFEAHRLAALAAPVAVVYPARDPRAVAASMAGLGGIDFVANQLRLLRTEGAALLEAQEAEVARLADPAQSAWTRRGLVWRLKTGRREAFRAAGLAVFGFAYERLLVEPDVVMEALRDHCGLSAPGLDGEEVYRGRGPDGSERARALDPARRDGWRERLGGAAEREVMQAAGPLAAALGYV